MNASTTAVSPGADVAARDRAAERARRAPFLPRRRVSGRALLWSPVLGAALVIPSVYVMANLPFPPGTPEVFPAVGLAVIVSGVLKHVLIGPLLEEIVFRGLLLQLARRYLATWLAVAISATVFAAPHLSKSLSLAVACVPLGCLFAWFVIRSGSLLPGFICHATFNLVAGLSLLAALTGEGAAALLHERGMFAFMAGIFPTWSVIVSIAAGAVALTALAREWARRGRDEATAANPEASATPLPLLGRDCKQLARQVVVR